MNGQRWEDYKVTAKQAILQMLGVVCKLDPQAGDMVLLTFDDGPHQEVTPGVLDRLKRYNVRAVFFVVGNRIPRAPWLLERILADGHIVGNHTHEHWLDHPPWPRGYIRDVAKCQDAVQSLTGYWPALFRPSLGQFTIGSLAAAKLHGLRTVHWSIDPGDWMLRSKKDALVCGKQLSLSVRPRDILLLHDDNAYTLTVLDVLLPNLVEQGFDLQSAVQRLS
jgi:peptidoglycan/xylan/chitin deacetylase (PgdA/CDA1 family)